MPTGRPPGAPAFQPSDEQRQMVQVLRGMQVPLKTIAQNIVPGGISEMTLKKYFTVELETGRELLLASLKTKIVQAAQNGSVRAQTWLLERLAPEEFGTRGRGEADAVMPATLTIQPNAQVSIYLPDNHRTGSDEGEAPILEAEVE